MTPQHYYPDYDIGLWTFCASVFGGSFGVFAGGFFSDRLVKVMMTMMIMMTMVEIRMMIYDIHRHT